MGVALFNAAKADPQSRILPRYLDAWKRRVELADMLDAGQITQQGYDLLDAKVIAEYEAGTYQADAERQQAIAAAQAQQRAQVQQQQPTSSRSVSDALIGLGGLLLARPPAYVPPAAPMVHCYTNGNITTCR